MTTCIRFLALFATGAIGVVLPLTRETDPTQAASLAQTRVAITKQAPPSTVWTTNPEESSSRSGVHLAVRTHFRNATRQGSHADLTLTVQMDFHRLARLEALAKAWDGPISCALLVPQAHEMDAIRRLDSLGGVVKANVDVHLVVADKTWKFYPINLMRNVAMDNAATDWVFIMDSDEDLGGGGMQAYLSEIKLVHGARGSGDSPGELEQVAYVVHSFQWKDTRGPDVPTSIDSLRGLIKSSLVDFKHPHYDRAYAVPTIDAFDWLRTNRAQWLPPKEDFEPYMVVRRSEVGGFDTRFVGFRGNYVSLTNRLQVEGFKFVLLPHLFTFSDETTETTSVDRNGNVQDPDLFGRVQSAVMVANGCPACPVHRCFKKCPKTSVVRKTHYDAIGEIAGSSANVEHAVPPAHPAPDAPQGDSHTIHKSSSKMQPYQQPVLAQQPALSDDQLREQWLAKKGAASKSAQ